MPDFQPATLTVEDMLDCKIQYVYARPHGYSPQIEAGKVIKIKQVNNVLWMLIEPHNPCRMTKWRSEFDFVSYAHSSMTAA